MTETMKIILVSSGISIYPLLLNIKSGVACAAIWFVMSFVICGIIGMMMKKRPGESQ